MTPADATSAATWPLLPPARLLALLLPAALLAGAWAFQLVGGLVPCEMCHWQRWPHYAALALALGAFAARERPAASRALVLLAATAILASGVIGVLHAGVEYHWWQGLTRCTAPTAFRPGGDPMAAILAQPLVRCDTAAWTLWGVSMAGWNALFSLTGGIAIWILCLTRPRP